MRDRTRISLLAIVSLVVAMASPLSVHAESAPVKVVIIVGPVGSYTSSYRSQADQVADAATADGATVVKVYSPNATWANVKAAANGANIILYLGHGNGYPNPYSTTYYPDRTDGWGLNRVAGIDADDPTGDGDSWSKNMAYCGEKALMGTLTSSDGSVQRQYCAGGPITPAPGWVMVYANACYTPGASEPGNTPATESVALERVGYYSRPVLATLGASGYFATDHGATSIVNALLANPTMSYGDIYAAHVPDGVTVTTHAHPFISADTVRLGKRSTDPYYTYAFAGDPSLNFADGAAAMGPYIVSRSPAAGATGVSMTPAVTMTFSEPVHGVSTGDVVLRRGSVVVSASVTYDADTLTATLRPVAPLAPSTVYKMALSGSIRDADNKPLSYTSWTFTTARSETYNPARLLTFAAGTYTGYRFDASGHITAHRTYTLARTSSAPTNKRSAISGQTGGWYYVTVGVWAGYWMHEGAGITLS